jgi:hypothetical protein
MLVLDVTGSFNGSIALGSTETFVLPVVPAGSYTLAVRATNLGGSSAPSNQVTLAFPSACSESPATPSAFLAYSKGRTLFVLWDPPQNGPAPTGYILNVTGALAGTIPTTSRMLSGSVGPGSYGLSVQATNACGSSPSSPEQIVTVP